MGKMKKPQDCPISKYYFRKNYTQGIYLGPMPWSLESSIDSSEAPRFIRLKYKGRVTA